MIDHGGWFWSVCGMKGKSGWEQLDPLEPGMFHQLFCASSGVSSFVSSFGSTRFGRLRNSANLRRHLAACPESLCRPFQKSHQVPPGIQIALTEEDCQRILPKSSQQTLCQRLSVFSNSSKTTDCTWICWVMIKSWRMARARNSPSLIIPSWTSIAGRWHFENTTVTMIP